MPAEQHSPEMKEARRLSDELVNELLALKAWIDHIVRKG
jgi:FMN-dependent NADH-azoreductase